MVDRCHRIARAYLRQRRRSQALREDILGEDVEDLAMDAIADLFERDERGRFPELRQYFSDCSPKETSACTVEQDLRRLVLGRVTDWLFEAYRTADRSLSNLIRALKRVIEKRDDARLHRQGRSLWLVIPAEGDWPLDADQSRQRREVTRPRMPMETLESHLTGLVAENPSTGELLDKAVETLRTHPAYEAAYPLTRLAQVMRAARVRVQAVTEHPAQVSFPDAPLFQSDEIVELIERTLKETSRNKHSTYVGSGKVDEHTYTAYFRALSDRLEARFVPPGNLDMTHYQALSAHLQDMSKEQYREHHRARFEYLVRSAQEALIDHLRQVV